MSRYSFRPIARSDFAVLSVWLSQPHAARWWADDASPVGVEADYGPVFDGAEPCEVFIADRDGNTIGLAQRLSLAAYPEYAREIETIAAAPGASTS